MNCPCGQPVHQYSPEFLAMWRDALRCFPLALPTEPPTPSRCTECVERRGRCSTCGTAIYEFERTCRGCKDHALHCEDCRAPRPFSVRNPCSVVRSRAAWLQQSTGVPELDVQDPEVQRRMQQARRETKRLRKLQAEQKRLKLKLHDKRLNGHIYREVRQRAFAIREVLHSAAQEE